MTDTEMVEGVPTKIVMVGTSSMSLHQSCANIFRFSRMPKPKLAVNKQPADRLSVRGPVRGRMRAQTISSRRATVMRPEPVFKVQNGSRLKAESERKVASKVYQILEPISTDFVEEFVPVASPVHHLRPPVLYRRPIEERVTLPPAPEVVYIPVPIPRNQRKVRGSQGRGLQRNQGQRNNVRGVITRGNFKGRPTAGRGGRATQGRGGGKSIPAGHYPPLAKKSISQLDRELEDYMRKSKHPKIVV